MHTGCLRGRCSDLLDECKDLSSEEITADAGSPGKDRQTTRRPHTSTMMYTQGGRGKDSGGSCPGSLEDCVALCPSEVGVPKNPYFFFISEQGCHEYSNYSNYSNNKL